VRYTGVTARGIISPIFRQGDNLIEETCQALLRASAAEGFSVQDGDIIAVTESVVARTQGNYATLDQMTADMAAKLGGGSVGIVFPILSRNRFSLILKAAAQSCKKLYVQLSYPSDEVGNALVSWETVDEKGINPYTDHFDEQGFRAMFGPTVHPFTGVDYIEYYKSLGDNVELLFSCDPTHILNYTDHVLCCDVHTRHRTARRLRRAGAQRVLTLDNILTESVLGSGYNPDYGLLGSNMATEQSVKLFPRDCQPVVEGIQARMMELTGKRVEVLIYGDGCFKDPVGGIWEFADPVVSPAFTSGLSGTPNELKIKYFADNQLSELTGDALADAMRQHILEKSEDLTGSLAAQGTTPRRYIDLIGSLSDLISGSGDRGTPIIHIQNYFTNYAVRR
jgi:F420-0:gamma-glutamyl ligase